jgi:hypothetical protein
MRGRPVAAVVFLAIQRVGWVERRGWARMTFQDAEAKQYRFCEANRMRRALRTTFAGRWAL